MSHTIPHADRGYEITPAIGEDLKAIKDLIDANTALNPDDLETMSTSFQKGVGISIINGDYSVQVRETSHELEEGEEPDGLPLPVMALLFHTEPTPKVVEAVVRWKHIPKPGIGAFVAAMRLNVERTL